MRSEDVQGRLQRHEQHSKQLPVQVNLDPGLEFVLLRVGLRMHLCTDCLGLLKHTRKCGYLHRNRNLSVLTYVMY